MHKQVQARRVSHACSHLARGECAGMCEQVQARVRDKADWLFKCVGAAHAALTDPAERRQLDADLAAQEGRASSASYYSNLYSQPPFRPARYSPQSSYHYGRTSDNYYG